MALERRTVCSIMSEVKMSEVNTSEVNTSDAIDDDNGAGNPVLKR